MLSLPMCACVPPTYPSAASLITPCLLPPPQHGGMTSHAAVVARGWGRPCVVGCNDLVINAVERTFASKTAPPGTLVKEGDYVSVNGTTGEVFLGACELMQPAVSSELSTFLSWARALCDVGVRVNADSGKGEEWLW